MRSTSAKIRFISLAGLFAFLIAFAGACTSNAPLATQGGIAPVADVDPQVSTVAAPTTREAATSEPARASDPAIAQIRDEGLNRSQVMQTLSYISDVIGPRLTGSPAHKRANEWTRQKLSSWGLLNAHLESWGPFGCGWTLKRFSAQVIEPQAIPLAACPKAWSPGFDRPITAEVVYLDAKDQSDLDKYAGKLKGAIVLVGSPRPVLAHYEAQGSRLTETELLSYANAVPGQPRRRTPSPSPLTFAGAPPAAGAATPTTRPTTRPRELPLGRVLSFLVREGAALVASPSTQGDGGTIFVASASLPGTEFGANAPRVWSPSAPPTLPQIVIATEDYNRLVRMIQQGQTLTMAVDFQVQFDDRDMMAYNTIAEIPGTDLKDEIVMLGGHLDSWHAGTGATDDAAGVAVAMEAVRIIQALHLKPRRTIRIALWAGEEQGLLGSKAYVTQHFGSDPQSSGGFSGYRRGGPTTRRSVTTAPAARSVRLPEYEKFSAYFNLDNGAGRIRGIYLQGNEALWPTFRRWLLPFRDLGAETVSPANTSGTDHLSFQAIGLPGFQFIQDPIEYMSRTHHSNADVYERCPEEDLKQASVIMAAFVYNAAMADEKLPRRGSDAPSSSPRLAGP